MVDTIEYRYNYSREVYSGLEGDLAQYNGHYDINNPMKTETLVQDVFAGLSIECNMQCNETTCSLIFLNTPLTEGQVVTLGNIVQSHKDYRPS